MYCATEQLCDAFNIIFRFKEINRPNAKQVGTIFIKYSKDNKVRQLFDIAKISHYSMKTCYALSILYYGLIVLCPLTYLSLIHI